MTQLKVIVTKIYHSKIWVTQRFVWGFGEISTYVNLIKDVGIILTVVKVMFGVFFGVVWSGVACLVVFAGCVILGIVLERTGMLKYATKISNEQNPEMILVNKIAKKLSIEE